MLSSGKAIPTTTWGYLVAVELEDGGHMTPEGIRERLTDAPAYMEGVGKIDVELLGKLDIYEEDKQ